MHTSPSPTSMETRAAKRRRLSSLSLLSLEQPQPSPRPHSDDRRRHAAAGPRISDLPDEILHHIFRFLPIKSMAQTSVVSKRWASLWHSLPDLDFTTMTAKRDDLLALEKLVTCKARDHEFPHDRVLKFLHIAHKDKDFITHVLNMRSGCAGGSHLRSLRFRAYSSFMRLNSLIRNAVKHHVKELDIEVAMDDYFNLPKRVVSECLEAFRFVSHFPGFRLPPLTIMKNGFKSLQILQLSMVILRDQPCLLDLFTESSFPALKRLNLSNCVGLERISIKCVALEDVVLEYCTKMSFLDVHGSKVERLRVRSCFPRRTHNSTFTMCAPRLKVLEWEDNDVPHHCSLESLSRLINVFVDFLSIRVEDSIAVATKTMSLVKFLRGISQAQFLSLDSHCFELLQILGDQRGFGDLLPFNKLRCLDVSIFTKKAYIPALFSIFAKALVVECLIIRLVRGPGNEHSWNGDLCDASEEEKCCEIHVKEMRSFLDHLKMVKIYGTVECAVEVSLVKFLLRHGRSLKEMIIFPGINEGKDSEVEQQIRSHVVEFAKVISDAKLSFH